MDTVLILSDSNNFSRLRFKINKLYALYDLIDKETNKFIAHHGLGDTYYATVLYIINSLYPNKKINIPDFTYNDCNESIVGMEDDLYVIEALVDVE